MTHTAKRWLGASLLLVLACDPETGDPDTGDPDTGYPEARYPEAGALAEHRSHVDHARTSEVIFSPQPPDSTHNRRLADSIASAQESIDAAVYNLDNTAVEAALRAAAQRGVTIRLIYEGARFDRQLDDDARARSQSGRLEAAGIDVRFVNKIMHHKLMIVDGPRDDVDKAATATLATGSGNWSDAAATRYDENTLFLRGHQELVLRMQMEFNLLWDHSRDFVGDRRVDFVRSELELDEQHIVDEPHTHALFTSANFDIRGDTTFTTNGRSTISDAIIHAIAGASDSIWIASGHLRSPEIAEALIAKAEQHPQIDIRVYLDAQEYISESAHKKQRRKLRACLAAALDDPDAYAACLERGRRFGITVGQVVAVRYKWYSYRWSYPFADQMHHKYLLIDGDELWTGSYNLSNNAEHNTMENMLVFAGPEHADLIAEYRANFERLWSTGRDEGLFERLCEEIATADAIPLLFEPMALAWEEVRDLKALIKANCPRVDTWAFRKEPGSHAVCRRQQ